MDKTSSEFAALATFKCFSKNKKSMGHLLQDFVIFSIIYINIKVIDSEIIQKTLLNEFNFSIPKPVIKNILTNLLKCNYIKRNEGHYIPNFSDEIKKSFTDAIELYDKEKLENEKNNDELISFVKNKNAKFKTTKEVFDIFRSLILGEETISTENNELKNVIGEYIINKNKSNESNLSWDIIKSSYVIREALIFNNNIVEEKIPELNIYLDMEVLFDLYNLNGTVYKDLFNDFFDLVKYINEKGNKISLGYFDYTREEIDRYFEKALFIYDNNDKETADTTAMRSIIYENVTERTDIQDKKIDFFDKLASLGIKEINTTNLKIDFENEYKNKNITFYEEDTIYRDHEQLNPVMFIDRLRISWNLTKLSTVHYLFVSRTKTSIEYALRNRKDSNDIPSAIHLDTIINKLWIASGKGLTEGNCPIHSVSFVQRLLSEDKRTQVLSTIRELKKTVTSENKEAIYKKIALYRAIKTLPEEMTSDTFDLSLEDETNKIIEAIQENQRLTIEKNIARQETENIRISLLSQEELASNLKNKISIKDEEIKNINSYSEKLENQLQNRNEQIYQIKIRKSNELEELINNYNSAIKSSKRTFKRKIGRVKRILFVIMIIYGAFITRLTIIHWENWHIEPLLATFPFWGFILYPIKKYRIFVSKKLRKLYYVQYEKHRTKIIKKNKINLEKINQLKLDIKELD